MAKPPMSGKSSAPAARGGYKPINQDPKTPPSTKVPAPKTGTKLSPQDGMFKPTKPGR